VTFERYALEWIDTYQGRTSRGVDAGTREEYRRSLKGRAARRSVLSA
jgi:hypothetical protein